MTEKQTLAHQALPLIQSSQIAMKDLEDIGYDPSAFKNSVWGLVDLLPEAFTPDERKTFQQAIRSFDEAMLRLVSGASISAGEHKTYRRMYFPMPGDNEELQQRKAALRSQVAEMTASLAEQNQDIKPGTIEAKLLKNIFDQGVEIDKKYGKPTGVSAERFRPGARGKVVEVSPGKRLDFDPVTRTHRYVK